MTTFEALLLLALSLAITLWQLRLVSLGLTEARREVSRYGLYRARDELILMVVREQVQEGDAGWGAAYEAVSGMLQVHERLDAFAVLRRQLQAAASARKNPRVARDVELRWRAIRRTMSKEPAFGAALESLSRGMAHAMFRQTPAWQAWVLRAVFGTFNAFGWALNDTNTAVEMSAHCAVA